jgi:TP901 family phage tail tape measure protein
MLNGLGLGITLFAEDAATATMDKVRAAFLKVDNASSDLVRRFDRNMTQFKQGLAVMGAGMATLGAAFLLANPAGKFEQAMADVQSISGATAVELGQLREAALQAGVATQFTPIEGANALRELAAQGFSAKESITLLQPALDLAAASLGELGVAEAAQLSAQTMKAFGIEVSGAKMAVDQLLQSANLFALAPKDLPMAVGIGARGAQLMHQSLEETLISLGLVKNVIPTVERASTAVAVAMERLAAPTKREMKYLDEIQLKAADATGKFKPFLDVIQEVAQKTAGMTDQKQALLLNRIFGAEGGAGAQAILTQLRNGIKTVTGEVLTGGKAIAYLRQQMADAAGTAKEFAERRLNTFEGQKTLLRGSLATLGIVVGDSFAKALRPVVSGVLGFVNTIIRVVMLIPDNIKGVIAQIVVAVGGALTAFGAFLAIKGAVVAFGIAMSLLGVTIGAVAAALAPVLALFAVGVLMFQAFRLNAEETGGGVFEVFSKLGLLFKALVQVFSTGAFSGAVLQELRKAGNEGIMSFAVQAFVWFNRVKNFFKGLADGFRARIQELAPTFDRLKQALFFVAEAFGLVVPAAKDNQAAFDAAGQTGRTFGDTLAKVAGIVADVMTVSLLAMRTGIDLAKMAWSALGPTVMTMMRMIGAGILLVVGLLSGDWARAWSAAKTLVFTVLEAIVSRMLLMPGLTAKIIDAIGHMAGLNVGASDALGRLKDKLLSPIEEQRKRALTSLFGEEPVTRPRMIPVAGGMAVPDTIAAPGLEPFTPTPMVTMGIKNAQGRVESHQVPEWMAGVEFMKAYNSLGLRPEAPGPEATAPAGPGGDIVTRINLFLDQTKLAEQEVRRRRDQAARSFSEPADED